MDNSFKFCSNCGTPLSDDTKFCPKCGTPVQDDVQYAYDVPEASQSSYSESESTMPPVSQSNDFDVYGEPDAGNTYSETQSTPYPFGQETHSDAYAPNAPNNDYFSDPTHANPQPQNDFQPPYQQPVDNAFGNYPPAPQHNKADKASVGFAILAWFIPLFGWIYCGVMKKERPKAAKVCGIVATVSFLLNFVLTVFLCVLGAKVQSNPAPSSLPDVREETTAENPWANFGDDVEEESTTEKEEETAQAPETTQAPASVGRFDWSSKTVFVNGKSVKLPCKFSEFANITGVAVDLGSFDKEERTVDADNTTSVPLLIDGEYAYASVGVYNATSAPLDFNECTVYYVSDRNTEKSRGNFTFPSDLYVGKKVSQKEILAMFDEPASTYSSDGYQSYMFRANKDDYYNQIEITIHDDTISSIQFDVDYK